jgi:dipeptidyl-peptidase-4
MLRSLLLAAMVVLLMTPVHAQNTPFTLDDLFDETLSPSDEVERWWSDLDAETYFEWSPTGEGHELASVNSDNGRRTVLATTADLTQAFAKLAGFASVDVAVFEEFTFGPKEDMLLFNIANDLFLYHITDKRAQRLTLTSAPEVGEEFSPDGKTVSYIFDYNIWTVDVATGQSRSITADGSSELLYGRLDWVYQEEIYGRGNFKGYWWSPDGQHLAFLRIDEAPVKQFPVVDHIPNYAEAEITNYPKAGAPNPVVTIGIVAVRGGDITWVDLSKYELFEYLVVRVGFSPDSSKLVFQIQDRIQTWLDLNTADVETGKMRTVLRETSKTWVNITNDAPYYLEDGSFYWISERTGYAHLYHYKANGELIGQLTEGEWEVRDFVGGDDKQVIFGGSKDTVMEDHYYSMKLKSKKIERITEAGWWNAADFNSDYNYYFLKRSQILTPQETLLCKGKGKVVRELFKPDMKPIQDRAPIQPEFVEVPTRDGFMMNAYLIKPRNFDPSKKYPVVSYNYSGPHAQSVTNRMRRARNMWWHQLLANEGYAIWVCDNRSASGKGHVSEATVYRQFGVGELRDLEDGIDWLTKNHDWVDADRIGLWGWSFGGYITAYALVHSDKFKIGISGAPVTDWHLYDSIYTERYMSTPQDNPEGYRVSSTLHNAADLHGKLLLVHGLMDDNVHFQNAVQLMYELQKANKQFEFMAYPKSRHRLEKQLYPHFFKMMTEFVRDNL